MNNLNPYTSDNYINRYDLIVNSKNKPRKGRLVKIRPTIEGRYSLYEKNFTIQDLAKITKHTFNKEESEDLLHCYESDTKALNELIVSIKEHQEFHLQGMCQYCGLNSDSTVDHYLPESAYPDYCVYPLNLIPSCADCNTNKGTFFYDALINSREILNLYLDILPSIQFMFLEITFDGKAAKSKFYIDNRNKIDPALYTILDRHFFRLKLAERFKKRFPGDYSNIYKTFKGKPKFFGNPALVTKTLLEDANDLYLDHGFNNWKRIIRLNLADNPEFLKLVTS